MKTHKRSKEQNQQTDGRPGRNIWRPVGPSYRPPPYLAAPSTQDALGNKNKLQMYILGIILMK